MKHSSIVIEKNYNLNMTNLIISLNLKYGLMPKVKMERQFKLVSQWDRTLYTVSNKQTNTLKLLCLLQDKKATQAPLLII